jgi:LysM repeat protein
MDGVFMNHIKRLFAISIIMLLMLGSLFNALPALAQGGTVVRVEPAALSAQSNDQVNVFIQAENVSGLTAFEIHLSFNPAVLEVLELTNGGFVAADFTVQSTFDNSAGTIDYAVAQLNRDPAQGNGVLLKVGFRARADGNSPLALRAVPAAPAGLLLADSNGISIQTSWSGGSVTVGSGQGPTVAPTTALPVTATVTATPEIPTPTPVATTAPGAGTLGSHTVRWGESLFCIGRGYQVDPWEIARVNNIRWWPYFIFPGQILEIPTSPWATVPAGPVCKTQFMPGTPPVPTPAPATVIPAPTPILSTVTPGPTSPPTSCRTYHLVRSGETLYRIGINYGVYYQELARVNQLVDPRLIYVGQRLCIP